MTGRVPGGPSGRQGSGPGRDPANRPHVGKALRTALGQTEMKLKKMTMVEASPQLLRLFRLSWKISKIRTVSMFAGNFVKSLFPAYDLGIRAELIDLINKTLQQNSKFDVRRIAYLLFLQLLSLLLKNYVELATEQNQFVLNTKLVQNLKRRLLAAHLKLDTVALERAETQEILQSALAITRTNALTSLTRTVFDLSNSVMDISARIVAASRTISVAVLPYFFLYSLVPLFSALDFDPFTKFSETTAEEKNLQNRKNDLSSIAFGMKSRREVSLLNLHDYLLEEYSSVDERLQNFETKRSVAGDLESRFTDIFSTVSSSAMYALVAYQSQTAHISLANLYLIESTVTGLVNSGERTLSSQRNSSAVLSNLVNFYKALDLQPGLPVSDEPIVYEPNGKGMTIEFRNVSFRYKPEEPLVLDDVSFVIPAGKIVALVGYNGSGKSTLISLLARIYDPTSGTILIDGIDLKRYDLTKLWSEVAYVPQDFARWPITAYENIAVGNISDIENEEKVKDAARSSGIFDTLEKPYGSSSTTSNDGKIKLWNKRLSRMTTEMQAASNDPMSAHGGRTRPYVYRDEAPVAELSGGQWQKLALARLFLRGGSLFILDEPSANLDPQAEYDLFCNLIAARQGRTILFITHRLGLVRACDQIMFLEEGKIVEDGHPEDLMKLKNGKYRHLVEIQAEGFR